MDNWQQKADESMVCVQPKEGLEEETFQELQQMMDWQKKSAKKLGVTMEEFTDAAVESQEAALQDMVDEMSGKVGVDPGRLMSMIYLFQDRTQRAADQTGLQHDEFLGAMFDVRCVSRYLVSRAHACCCLGAFEYRVTPSQVPFSTVCMNS